jgi:putative ABC transport system ATP-binding protein
MSVIEAVAITKRYDSTCAAAPTSLRLDAGELVVVAGPSGVGKTTLLNMLAGWEPPDAGTVTWNGQRHPPSWTTVTVIPQALALLDELTVLENVLLPARARGRGLPNDDLATSYLERLGLDGLAQRNTSEISVGERQRVMVARALCGQPELVLADEPTAHQDARHGAAVLALLAEAVERGAACVVASRSADLTPNATRALALTRPSE